MLTLRMQFGTGTDKDFLVSIPNVKAGLTQAAVEAAMDVLIAQDIFTTALVTKAGAEIVDRTSEELF
mgnify:CR=1 FL=1